MTRTDDVQVFRVVAARPFMWDPRMKLPSYRSWMQLTGLALASLILPGNADAQSAPFSLGGNIAAGTGYLITNNSPQDYEMFASFNCSIRIGIITRN